eukprot:TRINITY_DN28444_c0_g1_i1.p1 TRINITY_DN28444_c0_g1~~TRINITY_DN28444_c0_g1_i1.p1  ORF type:complete len:247 (-),score=35.49 TRINITY_DN28444_c0_g1_i1:82-822(-)
MRINLEFLETDIFGSQLDSAASTPTGGSYAKLGLNRAKFSGKQIYEKLHSETGAGQAKKWFLVKAANCPGDNALSEELILQYLRKLTDFDDYVILEIFDLLDWQDSGLLAFNEFLMLTALIVAREAGLCVHFLEHYGQRMFDVLADPTTKEIEFSKYARIGFILGVSEYDVVKALKMFDMTASTRLSSEEFLRVSRALLLEFDQQVESVALSDRSRGSTFIRIDANEPEHVRPPRTVSCVGRCVIV